MLSGFWSQSGIETGWRYSDSYSSRDRNIIEDYFFSCHSGTLAELTCWWSNHRFGKGKNNHTMFIQPTTPEAHNKMEGVFCVRPRPWLEKREIGKTSEKGWRTGYRGHKEILFFQQGGVVSRKKENGVKGWRLNFIFSYKIAAWKQTKG